MNLPPETQKPASLRRRVFGSFVAPFAAWTAFNAYCIIATLAMAHTPDGWISLLFIGLISGAFIFGTWLVVLIPLYLLVPQRSILCRWPVCTACGALAGPLIIVAWSAFSHSKFGVSFRFLPLAAIIGGVTCLVGSLTRKRFQFERSRKK